jgi:cholesterol transport system auxiliary component
MHKLVLSLTMLLLGLTACSPIKSPISHQYLLNAYSDTKLARSPSHVSILVTPTEAVSGYQTKQMQYSTESFALNSFSKNGWKSPPAAMIYPLLVQSLQHSGYFFAVGSGAYLSKTVYRLDTQLLKLQQNFIQCPSVLELKVKAVLTVVENNQIVASKIFNEEIPCSQASPYGGVLAANQATLQLTKRLTQFVIQHARQDNRNL